MSKKIVENEKKVEKKTVTEKKVKTPSKVEILEQQIAELKEMLMNQSKEVKPEVQVANVQSIKTSSDIYYPVKSLLVNRVELSSPNGSVMINFQSGEETDVSEYELREILKRKHNKDFFEKGVLFFTENKEELESLFKIKVANDLSEDVVLKTLIETKPENLTDYFNKLTDGKNRDLLYVTHTLWFIIIKLEVEGKLKEMTHSGYSVIEKYFDTDINVGITNYKTFILK